ncbi:dynamin family protein [Metabacillus iocasae]|uniref:GTPase n=1 Tax=Priestia iocasae TaxID=2291674 RepID=A0ABS2QSA7_9BACI|nr:dynamin family protein [Metabacillus iocasae]MBM7702345.1 putative GTPase [Metabacillus iocasae]
MQIVTNSKRELLELVKEANLIAEDLSYKMHGDSLDVLNKDMEEDVFMIVTVGEFNNGKSTFLNALLGEDVLPTGITPTTATINAITWGDKREFQVHKVNSKAEQPTKRIEDLNQFIASSDFNPKEIEYLKIFNPSAVLKDKMVLVDTPGLNDINTIRSNVTYQFIPRADVIFFIVNISAPLRKTEYTFLSETLLKQGLDRIIFIANFIDRIEEEEDEVNEVLIDIQNRIKASSGLKQVDVFPLSAYEALTGKLDNDEELIRISGITAIEERMKQLCQSGSRSEEKTIRYKTRLMHSLNELLEHIREKQVILQKEASELNGDLDRLLEWKGKQKDRDQMLHTYIDNRKAEIVIMVRKSIDHLFEQVNDEVEEKIQFYNGSEMNEFLKSHISSFIKRRLKQWIEGYSDKIHILLGKLETEISTGLTRSFQEEVKINSFRAYHISSDQDIHFEDRDTMDPIVTSGLLVGGISSLAMILGGPILIPIIGMAGLPFIQKKLLKQQLETIKPEVISEARKQLYVVKQSFSESIERYIHNSIEKITQATMDEFNYKSRRVEQNIEFELKHKRENIHAQNEQKKQLLQAETRVGDLINKLN